eukprot:CAMPEP_0176080992 /NCGR_PEP_ID=MMETSP0120_2-20121206/40513_1 /TAXON_ID=160619 /ORGANISM="Kryptoperidinium foliaceum, Strain CCMP 1326" /LENGTH=545 /DNA_ID=CAMNT_0017414759 /DNA_START=63 /DNA_END=1700 /DNA_ORIENTATION=+
MPPRVPAALRSSQQSRSQNKSRTEVSKKQAAGQGGAWNSAKSDSVAMFDDLANDAIVTDIPTPEWLVLVLAVTRYSELRDWVVKEREERSKDTYQNPHAELFYLVSSIWFESGIAVLIVLNCVLIGVDASWPDDSASTIFSNLEHVFVFLFFGEWCMRVRAYGLVWVFEKGNAADTFLVFGTGVIPKWIFEPLGSDVGSLRILTVLRALRLARIVRVVRLLPQAKELWMLIQGLLQSFRPLLWTSVIGTMILYIFGVAGTELIGRSEMMSEDEYAQELFGDPLRSMFTLFQVMTLDAWGDSIARPMMAKEWGLCLFFVFFIMVGVFVFWNLITAIIVENAMSIASDDMLQQANEAAVKKKAELKALADVFLEIDADGSGELSRKEFFGALQVPKVVQRLEAMGIRLTEMEDIWEVLNDGDGSLTIKEFTDGLRRMNGTAKARDLSEIIQRLRISSLHHTNLVAQVGRFNQSLSALENDVRRMQDDTGEVVSVFREMFHRLQAHIDREEGEDRITTKMRAAKREFDSEADKADFDDDSPDEDSSPI